MVRNYIKKGNRKVTSPLKLQEASKLIAEGWAMRAAARQTGVSKSALFDFVKKSQGKGKDLQTSSKAKFKLSFASRSIFTGEQEESIVDYCCAVARMGYGLTVDKVRELAYEVAKTNEISMPSNWHRNSMAGIDWWHGFKKRHGNKLSIRTPEACSIARAMAFNKPTVEKYYNKLEEVLNRHTTFRDGSRVYNLDETSTSTVQNVRKLVAPKGVKQLHQVKTGERGVSVTTTAIIGANGTVLPPVMIFPRKVFKSNMLINAYPGTLGLANERGYNTKEAFFEILKHYIRITNSSLDNPTLLLMDNVETHFSAASLDLAKDNGVVIFTFPPHCTHKLQPLDVGFFGPFKRYYDSAIHNFIVSNPGVPVTIYHLAGFVRDAVSKAGTPCTILNGFRKPGIIPFNRDIFQDSDFMMASVTEQPDPQVNSSQDTAATTGLSEEVPGQDEPAPSTSGPSTSDFVTPENIRGYPHAKPTVSTRKPRRKGKSMVATDTPEKRAIEQREAEVNEKKEKAAQRKRQRILNAASGHKNNKKKRRQTKKGGTHSRVLTFESEDDQSDTVSDIEDDPEPQAIDSELSKSLSHSPSVSDYVLVCFKGKEKVYFVGQITQREDEEGDLQISYLRKTAGAPIRFIAPLIPDEHSVHVTDIKVILPEPSKSNATSKRQKSGITFNYNFDNIKLG